VHETTEPLVEVLVELGPQVDGLLLLPVRVGPLDGEVDLAVVLDVEDLDLDLVTLRQLGVDVLDELGGDLRDVHETGDGRALLGLDLDERAVLLEPDDLALDDLSLQLDQLLCGPGVCARTPW
jgi:hypothetical protein